MHEWWDIQMLWKSPAPKSLELQERDLSRLEARSKVRSKMETVEGRGLGIFEIDGEEEDRLFASYDARSKVDATLSAIGSVSRARQGRFAKIRKSAAGSYSCNRRSLKTAVQLVSAASQCLI